MIEKLKSLLKNKKILCVVLGIVLVIIATVTILITINCKDSKNKASSGELFSTEKLTTKQEKTTKKEETTKAPPETTTETQSSETTTETTTAAETKVTTEPTTKKDTQGSSTGGSQEVRDDGDGNVSPGGTGGGTGSQGGTGDQGGTDDPGETVIKERKEDTQRRDELFNKLLFDKSDGFVDANDYYKKLAGIFHNATQQDSFDEEKVKEEMHNLKGEYGPFNVSIEKKDFVFEKVDITRLNDNEIYNIETANMKDAQKVYSYEEFIPFFADLYVYKETDGRIIMYLAFCTEYNTY